MQHHHFFKRNLSPLPTQSLPAYCGHLSRKCEDLLTVPPPPMDNCAIKVERKYSYMPCSCSMIMQQAHVCAVTKEDQKPMRNYLEQHISSKHLSLYIS